MCLIAISTISWRTRKTFYKHFGSIDGLLAYVLDSHIDDIVENTHGLLACTGESEQGGFAVRIQVFFEMVNRAIMENISLKRRVFECVPFDLMFTCCTGESEQGGFAVRIQVFFEMVNRAIMENISLKRRVFECVPFDLMFTCIKQSMYEELERYCMIPASVRSDQLDYYLSFVFGGILSAYRQKQSMYEELERYCMIPASVRSDQLDYYLSFVFGGILSAYRQWIMMGGDTPIENVFSSTITSRSCSAGFCRRTGNGS